MIARLVLAEVLSAISVGSAQPGHICRAGGAKTELPGGLCDRFGARRAAAGHGQPTACVLVAEAESPQRIVALPGR
ncbi:hypothetical protein [Roseivivax sediminis]|uniref:Uncharacterized protein n=1 Tax=Roseivivax sediminis TaxID=936889 RepID=A0A1I2AEG0_9RHOB|nr:hypothetical protein [Roseivivax sediminis]SFE41948.1 hypothetical protein SAMN04515678_109188 [Roseivivax sediminis]